MNHLPGNPTNYYPPVQPTRDARRRAEMKLLTGTDGHRIYDVGTHRWRGEYGSFTGRGRMLTCSLLLLVAAAPAAVASAG
eukprot:2605081-Prymnesium_polylepis.1